jgi:hypothetical protein
MFDYPDRGATAYQDFMYVICLLFTNILVLVAVIGIIFIFMLHYGYKSITIKFSKKNKLLRQIKHNEKMKEKSYIDRLDKKFKTKHKKHKH